MDWAAGNGGINNDDFSHAAEGEASWTEARTGEVPWRSAGGLTPNITKPASRYVGLPLAVGTISRDNSALTVGGARLLSYLQQSQRAGLGFDLLLKLEDEEENRWGTELAILSSNFGDHEDIASKRPRLDFEVELRAPGVRLEEEFVLETGMDYVLPPVHHRGRTVLLSAEIAPDGPGVPPAIFLRGGEAGRSPEEVNWQVFDQPVVRQWQWSQFKLSNAHNRLPWGEPFSVSLSETWVQPGPREQQLPEMVLIAPSGKRYRVEGRAPPGLEYLVEFQPDELGLWRYGWSFRPTPERPLGGHQGEGVFYVDTHFGNCEGEKLEEFANYIISSLSSHGYTDPSVQVNVNGFVRWVARYAEKGPLEKQTSERLLNEVKEALVDAGG